MSDQKPSTATIIGTVELLRDRVYGDVCVPAGTYPVTHDGLVRLALEGYPIIPAGAVHNEGGGMLTIDTADRIRAAGPVKVEDCRSWTPEEFAEFLSDPLCQPGPDQRMVICLNEDWRTTERPAHAPITYSLAEVRNGTGWPQGARFALAMGDSWLEDLLAEITRLRKIREGMERYVPCPDHRDKVTAGECLACRRDALKIEADRLRAEVAGAEAFKDGARAQRDTIADALTTLTAIAQAVSQRAERMAAGLEPSLYLHQCDSLLRHLGAGINAAEAALRAAGRL